MTEKLTFEKVKQFIDLEVDEFSVEGLRRKHEIDAESSVFYTSLTRLVQDKVIKRVGRGSYRKVKRAFPVKVFGRERKPPVELIFPRDFNTMMEMPFSDDVVLREGDLILISGVSNFGKSTLCMNFCGENIHMAPILMGNEYTTIDGEPSSRFLNRLDSMDWVQWYDDEENDRFTLLPIWEDYAEHIIKDKLNIIDWVNLPGEFYMISPLMQDIKKAVGKGVGIIAIQKNKGSEAGRGGAPTRDFADLELLIDSYDENEVLLTIGKVKETKKRMVGRMFVYGILQGVKIVNFREVVQCPDCFGKGWRSNHPCDTCNKRGKIDK